uniref:Uncharacterized protein n=1 Tax=Panagrolaimus superbus TaxID=310955 RepID=A0A914YSX4_9BILA
MACNLHYICPQIYKNFYGKNLCFEMNISKNPSLKTISFIPKYIYQPISAKEIPTDEWYTIADVREGDGMTEWSTVVTDTDILRNTKKFPTLGNKPVYEFKKCVETETDLKGFCKCCANCKYENDNFLPRNSSTTVLIEQLMIMDFKLSVVKEEALGEDDAAFYTIFYHPAWQSGKWKATVKTRLCQNCIVKIIDKTDQAFEAFKKQPSNTAAIKKQRLNVNDQIQNNVPQMPSNDANFEEQNVTLNNSAPLNVETFPQNTVYNLPQPQQLQPEITWIKYITEDQGYLNPPIIENTNWLYFYPTMDDLIYLCHYHNLQFHKFAYEGCNNFYGSNIFGKTNLCTVKFPTNQSLGYCALSYLLTGSENSVESIRALIQNQIQQYFLPPKFYEIFAKHLSNPSTIDLRQCDLYVAANLFHLNIFLFNNQGPSKWHLINESLFYSEINFTQFDFKRPSLLLSSHFGNGFNAILAAVE